MSNRKSKPGVSGHRIQLYLHLLDIIYLNYLFLVFGQTGLSKQCIDPDQMLQNAASDQGLHCLLIIEQYLET